VRKEQATYLEKMEEENLVKIEALVRLSLGAE
jgi:hypothetical protein